MAERRVERFKEKMTEEAQYVPYAERAVASVYRLRFTTNQLIRRAVQWFAVLMHIVEAVRAAMGEDVYDAMGALYGSPSGRRFGAAGFSIWVYVGSGERW